MFCWNAFFSSTTPLQPVSCKVIITNFALGAAAEMQEFSLSQKFTTSAKTFSNANVVIGNPERHVRKASHRGSKQQQRSCSQSLSLLLARTTNIYFCSSRTSRSWWITHSTQHHRRGCNNIPSSLQRTTPIARSLCEGWIRHDLHILVTAPFCCRVSHCNTQAWTVNLIHSLLCHDEGVTQARGCLRHETGRDLRGDTAQFIASRSALVLMTQNGNIYRPLTKTVTCPFPRYSSKHIAENSQWISKTTTRSRHYWRKELK